jgi:hypothetical protein
MLQVGNVPNPSRRTIALELTQLVAEMSTRNLPVGKRPPIREDDNLTAICDSVI